MSAVLVTVNDQSEAAVPSVTILAKDIDADGSEGIVILGSARTVELACHLACAVLSDMRDQVLALRPKGGAE